MHSEPLACIQYAGCLVVTASQMVSTGYWNVPYRTDKICLLWHIVTNRTLRSNPLLRV
jgi:hypothetical protein